jgi:hypothetical protein
MVADMNLVVEEGEVVVTLEKEKTSLLELWRRSSYFSML